MKPFHQPIRALLASAFLLAPLSASIESALAHGVPELEYRDTRALWAKVRPILPDISQGEILPDDRRGFDASTFNLAQDSEVIINWVYDGNRINSTLGWYDARDPSTLHILWRDASSGSGAPLEQGSKISLGVLPAGCELRFFLREDGSNAGENLYYMDDALNPNGLDYAAANLLYDYEDQPIVVGFEDRPNDTRRDQDFNDVMFSVEFIPVANPSVHTLDVGSAATELIATVPVASDFPSFVLDPVTRQFLLFQNSGARLAQVEQGSGALNSLDLSFMRDYNLSRVAYAAPADLFFGIDANTGSIVSIDLSKAEAREIFTYPEGSEPVAIVYDERLKRLLVSVSSEAGNYLSQLKVKKKKVVEKSVIAFSRNITALAWHGRNQLIGFDYNSGELLRIRLTKKGKVDVLGETGYAGVDADLASTGTNKGLPGTHPFQTSDAEDIVSLFIDEEGTDLLQITGRLQHIINTMPAIRAKNENLEEYYFIPAKKQKLTFKIEGDYGGYKYTFGFFDTAVVEGLTPGTPEYSVAAVSNGAASLVDGEVVFAEGYSLENINEIPTMLFDNRTDLPGKSVEIRPGKLGLNKSEVAFFILPNAKPSDYLADPLAFSPRGNGKSKYRQPIYSVAAANPGGLDHLLSFQKDGVTYLLFEDLSRFANEGERGWKSDNSFDDLVISIAKGLRTAGTPNDYFLFEPAAQSAFATQTSVVPTLDTEAVEQDVPNLQPIGLESYLLPEDSYLGVTVLEASDQAGWSLYLTDPARPEHQLTLLTDIKDAQNGRFGLGLYGEGTILRFQWTNGSKTYSTNPALNEGGLQMHVDGYLPETGLLYLELSDETGALVARLAIHAEPWSLQHSGDVRNLLEGLEEPQP